MNTDDLRGALTDGAANQPPLSPDLRQGVARAARRQRQRMWLAATPAALLVFVGGAALGAAQRDTTTLDTVSDPTAPTTVAPVEETTTTTAGEPEGEPSATQPPVTEPEASDEDDGEADDQAAPLGGDCGTVTVDAPELDDLPDESTEPLECFARALDADVEATVTVVTKTPDGSMTAVLTSAPGHRVTMALDGEVGMQLPDLPDFLDSWLDDYDDAPADCDVEFAVGTLGWDSVGDLDFESIGCLIDAVLAGDGGTVRTHLTDDEGSELLLTLAIADGEVTLTGDGAVTIEVPDDLLPAELLDMIPSDFGIDGSSFDDLDSLGDLGDLGCSGDNDDDPPWCD